MNWLSRSCRFRAREMAIRSLMSMAQSCQSLAENDLRASVKNALDSAEYAAASARLVALAVAYSARLNVEPEPDGKTITVKLMGGLPPPPDVDPAADEESA